MKSNFYITTAIPYVNAAPHIGHALEFIQADVIARWHRQILHEPTVLLSGGDENALKNVQAAQNAGIPIQEFIDKNTTLFQKMATDLSVHFDYFQKGSDTDRHFSSSKKLWLRCDESNDIYKKEYEGLYCLGCEAFYTKDELNESGECFEHPGKPLEKVQESNYFFRLSRYQDTLIKLIQTDELRILPAFRKNEVLSFLKQPLQDISISRSNNRAKNWGVPVPNDDTQRMYVWFDALNIYQSGIGYGWNETLYQQTWPADIHLIGKGITRFHAIYWPAFLLSAKLQLPKSIWAHGYFTVNGQKMSKTLGNVIDPFSLIQQYGSDAIRYYFIREIPSTSDGDFSEKRFKELYNADLASGIGNLVSRTAKLAKIASYKTPQFTFSHAYTILSEIDSSINSFELHAALQKIWNQFHLLDRYISETEPWNKTGSDLVTILDTIIIGDREKPGILPLAFLLEPFMPESAKTIQHIFSSNSFVIEKPLFPRLSMHEEKK